MISDWWTSSSCSCRLISPITCKLFLLPDTLTGSNCLKGLRDKSFLYALMTKLESSKHLKILKRSYPYCKSSTEEKQPNLREVVENGGSSKFCSGDVIPSFSV